MCYCHKYDSLRELCTVVLQHKPVEMLYIDVDKDPVETPQNLAASLLEVLRERDVLRHGKN